MKVHKIKTELQEMKTDLPNMKSELAELRLGFKDPKSCKSGTLSRELVNLVKLTAK